LLNLVHHFSIGIELGLRKRRLTDGYGHDVGELGVRISRFELSGVRFARVVDDAVDEARDMQELHLDDEGGAFPIAAADVEDRKLCSSDEG
jgi:hypothetical protein